MFFRPNHPVDGPALILPSPLPKPGKKEKPRPATPTPIPPSSTKKRPAPDDVPDGEEPSAKRAKTSAVSFTPSKKRKLEEDGLIVLYDAEETIEEADPDIIEID